MIRAVTPSTTVQAVCFKASTVATLLLLCTACVAPVQPARQPAGVVEQVGTTPTAAPSADPQRAAASFEYGVRIVDDQQQPVASANLQIEVTGKAPLTTFADSNGFARVTIAATHAGQPGRVQIEAAGYAMYHKEIDLYQDQLPSQVQLNVLPADATTDDAAFSTLPSEAAPNATTLHQINLHVLTGGDTIDTWILSGEGLDEIHTGDSLIVYGVIVQGTEVAIAQVQVIAQNPGSLIVQVVLQHPEQPVRSGMRADANLNMLEESMLVPAADFADGYLLEKERIRLRKGHDLTVGALFQAYEAQKIGQRISDYLPFSPPILMRITGIGVSNEVASAELVSGEWPQVGTLVSNMGVDATPTATHTPLATATPVPAPTETPNVVATIVADRLQQETAVAATLTAQVAPRQQPPTNMTPIPAARTIEILDPRWGDSRQGWQTVRWRYSGQLQPGEGFDLVLWYIEENRQRGVTDARAIADKLERHGNNEFSVLVNLSAAESAKQYCDAKYLLAVTVVQLEPYKRIGPQSDAVQIQVAPLPGGPCQ